MAETPSNVLSLSLSIERQFQEINLAMKRPTMPSTSPLATSSSTMLDDHTQALAQVRYYALKVLHYRQAQEPSPVKPKVHGKSNGRLVNIWGLKAAYIKARVDEGCAAEQLFKWYAKAVTGEFLSAELLRMIVEVGYPWHYPVVPRAPLAEKTLEEMREVGIAMGCSKEVDEWMVKLLF